jgi:general secretion pathway protein D
MTGVIAAVCLVLTASCAEYEAIPRPSTFEREANRIQENLEKPVPVPRPGVKTEAAPALSTASPGQPYIVGQGPSQDLFGGLANAPLNLDLRFEDAEIREVATTILGDILKKPYVIDTTLSGRVSLRIARNVSQRGLMEALRQSVTRVGGDIRLANGTYEISNATAAGALDNQKIAQLRAANPSVSIVPLRFAKPTVVSDLLKAIYPSSQITVDEAHNLLIIVGTQQQRDQMASTAESLDVDGMSNKTVAVYPIGQGNAAAVVDDLRKIYASSGGAQNSPVEFIALGRSNSVMAIARQQGALARVGELIRSMDQRRNASGRRMYVIQLQHARAQMLAGVLRESLGIQSTTTSTTSTTAATVGMATSPYAGAPPQGGSPPQAAAGVASLTGAVPAGAPPGESGGATSSTSTAYELDNIPLRIVANIDTNSIVIFATPGEFGLIQEAVRRLDAMPLQVLIEATIMDVQLTDQLQFGVQAFLQQQTSAGNTIQAGVTAATGFAGLVPQTSGFNFIFASAGQVQAAINALRAVTKVTVLSSPQVVTLDNQPAKLEVGQQVPITTQTVTNTTTNNPAVVNSISYVQTGVILHVTPRVNTTGGVDLDIRQEVTDAPPAVNQQATSLTPILNRRNIETRVSVQSTQTVALGGLITENTSDGRSRVPLLGDLPVVGWLFGQTNQSKTRQELLVFITPTVFTSPEEARNFSLDLRRRIDSIWKKEGSAQRSP